MIKQSTMIRPLVEERNHQIQLWLNPIKGDSRNKHDEQQQDNKHFPTLKNFMTYPLQFETYEKKLHTISTWITFMKAQ